MAPSDYRGLIGLGLIILAAGSLSAFLATSEDTQKELIRKRFKYLCLIPAIVMSGFFIVRLPAKEFVWLLAIWGATIVALYSSLAKINGLWLVAHSIVGASACRWVACDVFLKLDVDGMGYRRG